MTAEDDRRFMALALTLAERGVGNTWPNPAVGCVIVRDGRVIGRGWTQPGGRPHAETMALAQAAAPGAAGARGATAYVTLEPCAHHGRTPPCAEELVAAGLSRVVSAITDPDARVSGKGHAILTAAGIRVDSGCMAAEAARLQRGFLTRIGKGRPMLTLKLAMTVDGRIATSSGESRWITGPGARAEVHGLRARHDAVMVGGGTARADDPLLTVRGFGPVRQPVRIVVSSALNLSPQAALMQDVKDAPVWIIHGPEASTRGWQDSGARLMPVDAPGGEIDPGQMMSALGAAGLTRVLCEGGGRLAASLLKAGVVDELVAFGAGRVLGQDAVAAVGPLGLETLAAAPRFALDGVRAVGGDVMARWVADRG